MSWRHRAACRTEDPELFFPIGTGQPALRQLAEAQSVCRRCPVVGECLGWALDTGQNSGVWGGMSEEERRRLRQSTAPGVVFGGARVLVQVERSSTRPGPAADTDDRARDGRAGRETG